jgi:hypothetical protein
VDLKAGVIEGTSVVVRQMFSAELDYFGVNVDHDDMLD